MTIRFTKKDIERISRKGEAFIDRLWHLNPVPAQFSVLSPKDFYYGFFDPETQKAMDTINRVGRDRNDDMSFYGSPWREYTQGFFYVPKEISGEEDDAKYRVVFEFAFSNQLPREKFYVPEKGSPEIYEDHPYYDELLPFVQRHIKLSRIIGNAKQVFGEISSGCKTPGQWKTVFPQFVVLLSEYQQQAIRNQKRGSPWPSAVPRYIEDKTKGLAGIFAKCALLPEFTESNLLFTIDNFKIDEVLDESN